MESLNCGLDRLLRKLIVLSDGTIGTRSGTVPDDLTLMPHVGRIQSANGSTITTNSTNACVGLIATFRSSVIITLEHQVIFTPNEESIPVDKYSNCIF